MRISDWSSDVCSSDLDWTLFQSPILLGVDQIGTWLEHAAAQLRSSGRDALVGRILWDALLAYPAVGAALAGKAWLEQGQPLRPDAATVARLALRAWRRSEEHTSELQSLMRISYAVCCLKKKTK